jgi:hypothetical protein
MKHLIQYEFVSGDIPKSHQLDMEGYSSMENICDK